MSTGLIAVILGSAFLHAAWNSIVKGGSNKLFEIGMVAAGAGLCALLCLPFLPFPAAGAWPYLLSSICIHFIYHLLVAHSYKGADMSYAYTIMRGSAPLLTALAASFFMGEALSLGGWAGVLLLSAGILLLAADSVFHGCFRFWPTVFAVANAFVIMGYTVLDGGGVRLAGNSVSYVCWVFFINLITVQLFIVLRHKKEYLLYMRQRWQVAFLGGFCSFMAYGLSVWAMAYAPVSLVAALRETSVIFGMILAVFILKEKFYMARALSVLLVVAGAASIKFFA